MRAAWCVIPHNHLSISIYISIYLSIYLSIYPLSEAWLVVSHKEPERLTQGVGTLVQDGAARREEECSVWQRTQAKA